MTPEAEHEHVRPEVDAEEYRRAIAYFATGVTVVTTRVDGRPVGMTASAVCSVSLDPVLLLVCIDNRLRTHAALDVAGRFAINVLGAEHEHLARQFASQRDDKFDGVALREESDLPVLRSAIAHFACELHEKHPGGDHSIFLGRVTECSYTPGRQPLLYFKSSFGKLEDPLRDMLGHPFA